MNIQRIRAGIPALAENIYLNTGTFGPLPTVVADEIRHLYTVVEQQGTFSPAVFWQMELEGCEAVRSQLAAFIGADPAEVALTRNVSDGINIVRHGLDWQSGDEIILSDHEHSSGTVPWLALAEQKGVTLRWLKLVDDADEIVARFEKLLTPHTKLACISHVSCLTGLRLPIERLCSAAREAGVLSLVDGAHAEGQFKVGVDALGCDFYVACGHKWLLGPQGVGMLYLRREHVERLRPAWLGWGVNQLMEREPWRYELESTAARFEQSTRAWPLYLAFGKAIEHIESIGLTNIQARVRQLRAAFIAQLAALPGATVHSPLDPALGTGLVTVSLAGQPYESLKERLWQERRIITNGNNEFNAVRFSLAFFTTEQELDAVLEILAAARSG